MHPLPLPGDTGGTLPPAGTWSLDLRTLALHWSDEIALIHGLHPGGSPGLSKALDHIEILDRAQLIASVLQSVDARGVFEADVRLTTAQGTRKLVRISGHIESDGAGRALALHGLLEDLSGEPLQTIDRAVRLAGQVMAHELKTRVGVISGFTAELERRESASLSPRGAHWLSRVRRAAGQADRIVDALALLGLTTPVRRAPIDVTALCRDIVVHLRERDPAREVEVTVQDGIELAGDPELVFLLLENLLSNAWKFTAARPDARIRVEAARAGGELVVRVADNGIGFEPHEAGRIFQLFTRLHGPQEYDGCGVGLALAWRVVERHDGLIWAHAEPGQGATYFFRL
jgi:signal transduction histidine kinase